MEKNLHIDQHISHRFNDELQDLRRRVLTMGGMVEKQCQQALDALVHNKAELAETVAGPITR
jgi:phosphate transport system protein